MLTIEEMDMMMYENTRYFIQKEKESTYVIVASPYLSVNHLIDTLSNLGYDEVILMIRMKTGDRTGQYVKLSCKEKKGEVIESTGVLDNKYKELASQHFSDNEINCLYPLAFRDELKLMKEEYFA